MPTDGTNELARRQRASGCIKKKVALVIVGESSSVQTCLFRPSASPLRPSALAGLLRDWQDSEPSGSSSSYSAKMFPSLPSLAASLSQPFKRSQLGLFHGKTKQYGNNVPFSKNKTRRSWLPNIQSKRLFSEALGEMVRVKASTRALKTIRKVRRRPSVVISHRSIALCSVAGSTGMCSAQSRTCSDGRACVCASR